MPDNSIALEGATIIEAFDRKFVLVAVHGLGGREAQLLTGTCEIRESTERSAVLAVVGATNRWTDGGRQGVADGAVGLLPTCCNLILLLLGPSAAGGTVHTPLPPSPILRYLVSLV